MNQPLVHVLVINWNGVEHLEDCFTSLLACPYENARFVLVDNGSTDGSEVFVRERFGHDPRVEFLNCGANLGWSGGNNEGIRRALAAGAAYVFLLNNDTRVAPDFLDKTVAVAEGDGTVGVVAPKMVLFGQPSVLNSTGLLMSPIGSCWDRGAGRIDGPQWNTPGGVVGACGGACLIRASLFEKTGLLPEEFQIYLDDLDLCLRVLAASSRIVYCPDAVVEHKFSASMGVGERARFKYYLGTRNRFWLILRNYPAFRIMRVSPLLLFGEAKAVGRAALDGEWWRAGAHARAWLAALRYIPAAAAHRRRMRAAGLAMGSFWRWVQKRPLFCPGVLLPENGWYAPRMAGGVQVRPMAAHARMESAGNQLRGRVFNCYPALGAVRIRIMGGGVCLAEVETLDSAPFVVHPPAGAVDFVSDRLFPAEETGELADFGAWIHVESGNIPATGAAPNRK